jgi:small subunit ribosomal protein S17
MSSDVTTPQKKQKTIRCKVVSDKMSKSRVGLLERLVKHPVGGKYLKRSSKYMFHDEGNISKEGDEVIIAACRPLSARKSFMLVSVVKAAKEAAVEV